MSSEDLLDHFKLRAKVYPTHTSQYSYKINRALGVREEVETRWNRVQSLGEGAFGQVWKEAHTLGDVRAVKIIEKSRMQSFQVDYKKEILALAKFAKEENLQADLLVSFLGWFETEKSIFLAMEYFEHGDLAQYIKSISTEDEVRQITANLLEGLKIMHKEGFAHRDLKPQNIFVAAKPPQAPRWWVKIGDFGISKRVKNDETALRTQTGTPHFQAPEVLGFIDLEDDMYEYNDTVDLWSLGCVVYNVSAQRVPFSRSAEVLSFCQNRTQLQTEPLTRILSKSGIDFIARLLMPEPARRMTIDRGLKDPWLLDPPQVTRNLTVVTESRDEPRPSHEKNSISVASRTYDRQDLPPASSSYKSELELDPQPRITSLLDFDADRTLVAAQATQPHVTPTVRPRSCFEENYTNVTTLKSSDYEIAAATLSLDVPADIKDLPAPQISSTLSTPEAVEYPDSEKQRTPPSTSSLSVASTIHSNWLETVKLIGHSAGVNELAFSPDGKLLASGSGDGTVRLWDVTACREYYKHQLDSAVNTVSFSPDGILVAIGTRGKDIQLLEVLAPHSVERLPYDMYEVKTIAFSSDGKLIALGNAESMIVIYDMTKKVARQILHHRDGLKSVAFSPDSTLLAAGDKDKMLRIWDLAKGGVYYDDTSGNISVRSVAFSPEGKLLAYGGVYGSVRILDVKRKVVVKRIYHTTSIQSIAFSPDSKFICSGGSTNTIRVCEVSTGRLRGHFSDHAITESLTSVAFSPDGKLIASAGTGNKISLRRWQI